MANIGDFIESKQGGTEVEEEEGKWYKTEN
jgi:hypothetical protein